MTNEEIAIKLAEHDHEIKVANHRIKDLEEQTIAINELALSTKEMAINMGYMIKEQERQAAHIEALESKPSKRLDTIITVIITALISGGVTYLFTHLF
jgi:hypothetical protein